MVYRLKKRPEPWIDNWEMKRRVDRYFFKGYKLSETEALRSNLCRRNLHIVTKINIINHTHGETCNYEPNAQKRSPMDIKRRIFLNRGLERANVKYYNRLKNAKLGVPNRFYEKPWRVTLGYIKKLCKKPVVLQDLMEKPPMILGNECRPIIYFDIVVKNRRALGRMIFVLYIDILPNTVEMFIKLCENHKIFDEKTRKENNIPTLVGSNIHRIFPDLYCEGGRLTDLNIDYYAYPENYDVSHEEAGTLSLMPNPNGIVSSHFTMSMKPLNVLNGRRVAFGRCLSGVHIVNAIEAFGTKNGKPTANIVITDCGLIRTRRFRNYKVYPDSKSQNFKCI